MLDSKKQAMTWNWRLGSDVFLNPVPTGSSLVGAPTAPEIHDFKIAEFAGSTGPFDASWIGMTTAGFNQLRLLATGRDADTKLLHDVGNALDALDIPYLRDAVTGSWRLHHEYSLALYPAGTPNLVHRGPRTALDSNPLARALADGVSNGKLRAAKAAFEAIKKRRRREAEAKLEGYTNAEWERYSKAVDDADARHGRRL